MIVKNILKPFSTFGKTLFNFSSVLVKKAAPVNQHSQYDNFAGPLLSQTISSLISNWAAVITP